VLPALGNALANLPGPHRAPRILTMSIIIYVSIPIFLLTMALEYAWARGRVGAAGPAGKPIAGYAGKDTLASLSMGVGNVIISGGTKVVMFAMLTWVYQHRLFTVPDVWWAWVILLFAEDLCYYWFHRASHEVRLLWAAHVNHHSSEHYNLSTALRQSWTTPFTGPWFWLPLPLFGFAPWMVLVQQAVSLLYQYWIHTEAIDRLGPLEWIFNTPSHHRVHHGANPEYLDKNHGGIFILWDRLFGSFVAERAPVRYGLTTNVGSFHPVRIAFHEWRSMFADVRRATSLRHAFGFLLAPPGWHPDGGTTSRALQAKTEA
jgi:sterol desaturase/sphingolipid hydroxylase (fatty acid hydroxylase superfamily)